MKSAVASSCLRATSTGCRVAASLVTASAFFRVLVAARAGSPDRPAAILMNRLDGFCLDCGVVEQRFDQFKGLQVRNLSQTSEEESLFARGRLASGGCS